ncbi:MAG: hypothetical protein ABEJ75_01780 [Candidatus Nanohaloarchaea archaeon]
MERMRKGFYFSFDAMIALMVMSATFLLASQASSMASADFSYKKNRFEATTQKSRDVIKMASARDFSFYTPEFRQELVSETVFTREDLDKTILEGVTYLWASGELNYARESVRRYFNSKFSTRQYRLNVYESGKTYTIYSTGSPDSGAVSSVSTLVSGFKLNATLSGYRARAKVLGAISNVTQVIPFSPAGTLVSGGGRGRNPNTFEVRKQFTVNADSIGHATLDIALSEGPSQQFRTLRINGERVSWPDSAALYSSGDLTYYRLDVTAEIDPGLNEVYIQMEDPRAGRRTRLYPGTRLTVRYQRVPDKSVKQLKRKRIEMKTVTTHVRSGDSGLFNVEEFSVPTDAEIVNATATLKINELDNGCGPLGWDARMLYNGQEVLAECARGDYRKQLNLTAETEAGSNIMTVYASHNGQDLFWGGRETRLLGGSTGDNASHITVWYREPQELSFNTYEARTAVELGGANTNPKTYNATIEYSNVSEINLYLSQFYSEQPAVEVKPAGEGYETVFNASEVGATPTLVALNPTAFDFNKSNMIRLSDPGSQAEFLRYTLFEYKIEAPTRVGYGDVFPTAAAARQDARERLKEKLGSLITATDIAASTVAIGGQRKLWGPSQVTLVVWNE